MTLVRLMGAREIPKLKKAIITLFWGGATLVLMALMPGCSLFPGRRGAISISPSPSLIESVSGYLSFWLQRGQERARGRVFFLLKIPGQGRLEISDPVGRLAAIAIWTGGKEWLIVPAKKAYWEGEGGKAEIMEKLLGFALEPEELLAWITGRFEEIGRFKGTGREEKTEGKGGGLKKAGGKTMVEGLGTGCVQNWQLEYDSKGLVSRGQKGDLEIVIIDRWGVGGVARVISFSHPQAHGRLTILGLEFNRPGPDDTFSLRFLEGKGYRSVPWTEIEVLLRYR